MGSLAPELILDHHPSSSLHRTIGDIFHDVLSSTGPAEGLSKLTDLVRRLEDEMLKMDALKRELPFSVLLIGEAIADLKQYVPLASKPMTADLISLKSDTLDLQLKPPNPHQYVKVETKPAAADVPMPCKTRNGGRPHFIPHPAKKNKVELLPQSLSVLTSEMKRSIEKPTPICTRQNFARLFTQSEQSSLRSGVPQQISRKQRRCWSPDLHRRFVHALQRLGGSKAATPKQIRELMGVDDLTNDEVKSHLQKFRLHTRKFPAAFCSNPDQPLFEFGSSSLDQSEDGAAAPKGSISQSGSPQGPLQLCGSAEAASATAGDSMEDEEDS